MNKNTGQKTHNIIHQVCSLNYTVLKNTIIDHVSVILYSSKTEILKISQFFMKY